jgi:poly(3-hydroxybutyrate) depolymerase
MTAILMAVYPEEFAGGAIIAGLPYKCAHGDKEAKACMKSAKDLTPAEWGDKVRQAASYSGPRPKIVLWQATKDSVVEPGNLRELMEQWTNVHGIDQIPDVTEKVNGHDHAVYQDSQGNARVETYLVQLNSSHIDTLKYKGHGTPIDPPKRCGSPDSYLLSANICSCYYIARAWGLASGEDEPSFVRTEAELAAALTPAAPAFDQPATAPPAQRGILRRLFRWRR